ncbi:MAG TPA: hypothetical protein VLL75_21135 [Vicinamibacteria bacterium]|nr:hypothetical protein [Vicinamibacteria bacterium]
MTRVSLSLASLLFGVAVTSNAGELRAALEGGAAWQTRNDFRIPGDGGTLVDLAAYESGPFPAFRAALTWDVTARQSLRLLAAPLRVETAFAPESPVVFQDLVFPAGQPLDATYVFNSYRLTWYWRFLPGAKWSFRLGATLKARDAQVALAGDAGRSSKDDLGLVPLVHLGARYQATERLALEFEADALAAPQGRAEDVSLKAVFRVSDRVEVDLGYRLLEGGADNDEVYTFAFFHYAVAGVRIRL